MNKVCDVCNRVQEVDPEFHVYFERGGPYVCSLACVESWLKSFDQSDSYMKLRASRCGFPCRGMQRGDFYSTVTLQYYRSSFELLFAERMHWRGFDFAYEPFTFIVDPSGMEYTPDFLHAPTGAVIEVKGSWENRSRQKVAKFRNLFPSIPLMVVHWGLRSELGSGSGPVAGSIGE